AACASRRNRRRISGLSSAPALGTVRAFAASILARNDRRLSNFATLQPLLPCRVWNLRPKHWGDGRRRRSYVLSGEFLGGLVEGGEHDCAKTLRRARWPSRLLRTNSPKINGSKSRICCPRAERMCTCRPATPQSDFLECAAHRFPNLGILV